MAPGTRIHTGERRHRLDIGCTGELVDRLEQQLTRLATAHRPDLVRGLIMLGSPVVDPLGAHPAVLGAARLSSAGLPGP